MKHFIISFLLILVALQVFPQKENISLDSLMSTIYPNDNPGAAIAIVKMGKLFLRRDMALAI